MITGLAEQAVKLPAVPLYDANVASAYALGWLVADALTWCHCKNAEHLEEFPGIPDGGSARWDLLIDQITFRSGQLNAHLASNKPPLDLSGVLTACSGLLLGSGFTGDVNGALAGKSSNVESLDTDIVEVLWATEFELAKAYTLGQNMQRMCTCQTADSKSMTVVESVAGYADGVHKLLITLASKLPANAAHATDNSLRLWGASLHEGGTENAKDLLRQGWRWRAVLSGEVAGKDGLRLSDYIGAAAGLSHRLRQTALEAARRLWWLIALAVLVAGAGVYLISLDTKGSVGAGITAVLAVFGITWKGVGEFFGRAAAKGEEQLWDAELDWAIAYRFTRLKSAPKRRQLLQPWFMWRNRPMKSHLARYNGWKAKWPDVDLTPEAVRPSDGR